MNPRVRSRFFTIKWCLRISSNDLQINWMNEGTLHLYTYISHTLTRGQLLFCNISTSLATPYCASEKLLSQLSLVGCWIDETNWFVRWKILVFFFLGYPRRYAGFYFYVSILLRWFTLRAWKSRKLNLDLIQDQLTFRHLKLKVSNYSMTKGKKCVILLLCLNLTTIFFYTFLRETAPEEEVKTRQRRQSKKINQLSSFHRAIYLTYLPES